MSDEQPTSWRDRFFGTGPARSPEPDTRETETQHDSAELAPDSTEVAATSVEEHDAHQPLVEHDHERDAEADTAVLDTPASTDDRGDSPIEPTVIAPSTLRGPSHSAAHPDDSVRTTEHDAHDEAATSSLEQHPEASDEAPPALVEPRRPAFGLRRHAGADAATDDTGAGTGGPDAGGHGAGGSGAGAGAGLAAAGVAGAGAAAAARSGERDDREFVEPEPTQAMPAQRSDDEATRAIDAHDAETETRVLHEQPVAEERTGRFGIVRDEVPASSIAVDDETARAAAGGTPIVLVEEPVPPRRRGARGVGFAVVLLATLIFGLLLAAAFFAVGYLFDRSFDATELLESVWLRPSFLLPVIVFFVAYLLVALLVNRAGWWAHVLSGFLVALVTYAAYIAGAHMEDEGGWEQYTSVVGIGAQELGQLLLAPLAVLTFVLAREVPIWVGGIVARRGRRAREWNRQAMDDFNAENAERLAAYERARG